MPNNYRPTKGFQPKTIIHAHFVHQEHVQPKPRIGSKSVALTLPRLIVYSLPAFSFFHMSSFYAPDKLKPVCHVCTRRAYLDNLFPY